MSTKTLLTSDDLWRMVADGSRYELSKGELLPMTPVGVRHAIVVNNVGRVLGEFVGQNSLGIVGPEIGFKLRRNPDTLRAPDMAFISRARYEAQGIPDKFAEYPPDMAVEVLSPEDTMSDVLRKVEEYLSAGVGLVWVADPATETVSVYHSLAEVSVLTAGQEIDGGTVLPGFRVSVAELFRV